MKALLQSLTLILIGVISSLTGCKPANNSSQVQGSKSKTPTSYIYVLVSPNPSQKRYLELRTASNNPILHFDYVSLGRFGVGQKHAEGDKITPVGEYKISYVKDGSNKDNASAYHKAFFLNYPSLKDAELGLKNGLINEKTYNSIKQSPSNPPQNTKLGGAVAIHGIGSMVDKYKDAYKEHFKTDWTDGCIALTDEQIDKLAPYIKTGMKVIVSDIDDKSTAAGDNNATDDSEQKIDDDNQTIDDNSYNSAPVLKINDRDATSDRFMKY